ncbi:hypothetical protein OENI_460009 [Oenococcus oeni]|nr:hypothetical protein OENI_460009 [Oenococcus oeni]
MTLGKEFLRMIKNIFLNVFIEQTPLVAIAFPVLDWVFQLSRNWQIASILKSMFWIIIQEARFLNYLCLDNFYLIFILKIINIKEILQNSGQIEAVQVEYVLPFQLPIL